MADKSIIEKIRADISKGFPLEQIKQELFKNKMSSFEVSEAIGEATGRIKKASKDLPKKISLTFGFGKKHHPLARKISLIIGIIFAVVLILSLVDLIFFTDGQGTMDSIFGELFEPKTIPSCGSITFDLKKGSFVLDDREPINCFIEAAKNCTKTKIHVETIINFMGVKQSQESIWTLKGLKWEQCSVSIVTENVQVRKDDASIQNLLNSGMEEEQLEDQQRMLQEDFHVMVGGKGNCRIPPEEFVPILEHWRDGGYEGGTRCTWEEQQFKCTLVGDWFFAKKCIGSYSKPRVFLD